MSREIFSFENKSRFLPIMTYITLGNELLEEKKSISIILDFDISCKNSFPYIYLYIPAKKISNLLLDKAVKILA